MLRSLALSLAFVLAPPGPARAEKDEGVVAVLPLVSSKKSLEIYGKPVADAVVGRLRDTLEMRVVRVSLSEPPDEVTLVVDGRILAEGGERISLEASVRDPARGRSAGRVATEAMPLTEIDALARQLAGELEPLIARAAAGGSRAGGRQERRAGGRQERRASPAAARPETTPAPEAREASPDGAVLVVPPAGRRVPGVDLDAVAAPAAVRLVRTLGYRPVAGEPIGAAGAAEVSGLLRRRQAAYALFTQIRNVTFVWRGLVLTARGRVRVTLAGPDGVRIYDKTVRTGTVVGSRGDGHPALVRFVAAQALDIVFPELRRVLAP